MIAPQWAPADVTRDEAIDSEQASDVLKRPKPRREDAMAAVETRPASWQAAFRLIQKRGLQRRKEPFKLASGKLSHDYIDGKYAIDTGAALQTVSRAMADLAAAKGIEYDAVGGLTMGADALAHGIAMVTGKAWFSVRKERKPRGTEQWIEGAHLDECRRVLLVDDVVSTGESIMIAFRHATQAGATIMGAIPMVDRGDVARGLFEAEGVPYFPLVKYEDLGIESVSGS